MSGPIHEAGHQNNQNQMEEQGSLDEELPPVPETRPRLLNRSISSVVAEKAGGKDLPPYNITLSCTHVIDFSFTWIAVSREMARNALKKSNGDVQAAMMTLAEMGIPRYMLRRAYSLGHDEPEQIREFVLANSDAPDSFWTEDPHRLHQLSTTSPGDRGTGLNAGYIDFATSIQHTGDVNSRTSLDAEGDSSLAMPARSPLKAEAHDSGTVQREREQIKEVHPSHKVTGISQPEQKHRLQDAANWLKIQPAFNIIDSHLRARQDLESWLDKSLRQQRQDQGREEEKHQYPNASFFEPQQDAWLLSLAAEDIVDLDLEALRCHSVGRYHRMKLLDPSKPFGGIPSEAFLPIMNSDSDSDSGESDKSDPPVVPPTSTNPGNVYPSTNEYRCPSCKQSGPSQETGDRACGLCGRCEACCEYDYLDSLDPFFRCIIIFFLL